MRRKLALGLAIVGGAIGSAHADTALVEIPDAPHNIAGRPSQLVAKIDHVPAWLAKYPPE